MSVHFFFFQAEDGIRDVAVTGVQTCALPISFPSPPFRSSDFAGPRRSRLYGFHTGTRSLSNRKGRGRRRGGREREPRRAGEGRLVWNRNSCVLMDYGLWAAKSEGRAFDNLIWPLFDTFSWPHRKTVVLLVASPG